MPKRNSNQDPRSWWGERGPDGTDGQGGIWNFWKAEGWSVEGVREGSFGGKLILGQAPGFQTEPGAGGGGSLLATPGLSGSVPLTFLLRMLIGSERGRGHCQNP